MFVYEEKVLANQGEAEQLWNLGTAWSRDSDLLKIQWLM